MRIDERTTYRSFFNRNRLAYFFHPRPAEIGELIDCFRGQGFITDVAVNVSALYRQLHIKIPDVILAHSEDGEGSDLAAALKEIAIGSRVYVITDKPPPTAETVKMVRAGALSVFAAPLQPTQIVRDVEGDLAGDLRAGSGSVTTVKGMNSLTSREKEVLQFLLDGASNKQAAQVMNISPRTIEVHRAHLMKKLGARNTAEMVRIALGR